MSIPTTVKGNRVLIWIGDGATPEAFVKFCGLKTKSFTDQVNTSDVFLEDCDDPDGIPVRGVDIEGRQWDISGEGFYNADQKALVLDAVGESKNYKFEIGAGEVWTGPAVLTTRSISSEGNGRVTQNMSFASDGIWTVAP